MTDGPFPPLEPLESPDQEIRLRVAVARIEQLRRRRAALAVVSFAAVVSAIVIPLSVAGGSGHPRNVEVAAPSTTASTSAPVAPPPTAPPTSSRPTASTTLPSYCDEPLTIGNDGTVAPVACTDGRVNAAALHYYEGGNPGGWYPTMLHLPSSATRAEAIAAMCHDIAPGEPWPSGVQTEQQAYQLAAQINGWKYGINVVYDDSACG